jgi:hypothetical protein
MIEPGHEETVIALIEQALTDLEHLQDAAEERGDQTRVEQLQRIAEAYRAWLHRLRETDAASSPRAEAPG